MIPSFSARVNCGCEHLTSHFLIPIDNAEPTIADVDNILGVQILMENVSKMPRGAEMT